MMKRLCVPSCGNKTRFSIKLFWKKLVPHFLASLKFGGGDDIHSKGPTCEKSHSTIVICCPKSKQLQNETKINSDEDSDEEEADEKDKTIAKLWSFG